jgi:hypothetical protein
VCPSVWSQESAPEGVPLGIVCVGPSGDPCVDNTLLEENPHVGRHGGCP